MSEQSAADVIAEALRAMPSPIAAQLFEPGFWRSCATWDQIIEKAAPVALAVLEAAGWATVKLPTDPQLNPRWRTLARINPGKATEFALSLLATAQEADK